MSQSLSHIRTDDMNKVSEDLARQVGSWQHWTGRTYYQHQQTPNQTDPVNQLRRAHQTAIKLFRLGTHHAPLNAHLHRIKKEVCIALTVKRTLTTSYYISQCTTTSETDCCQPNQQYTTHDESTPQLHTSIYYYK